MRIPSRTSRTFAFGLKFVVVVLFPALLAISQIANAAAIPQGNQGAGFLGQWCAQGDPNKQASITSNGGVFFNLTNENRDTSPGNLQGNVMSAPGWQFVTGTLSADGSRIKWSKGTFWARCNNRGGGGGG